MTDHVTLWKNKASGLAGIACLSFALAFGQVAAKLLDLTVLRIDVTVDCLVADPLPMAFVTQASSDLFRRSAVLQPLDHGQTQIIMSDQFARPRAIC